MTVSGTGPASPPAAHWDAVFKEDTSAVSDG